MFALADVNSFYASCERVFRPDLKGKPIVVLSNNDGNVIARSAEAKPWIKMGTPWFQQKPFHRKLPLHAGDNDIAVPRLFSTVHNQQIAIVQTAVGHAVSAGTQVVRRARMPYAVIMEIQIGLDIVSSRAGKTAAGQIGKQWMGLWREFFPGAEKL